MHKPTVYKIRHAEIQMQDMQIMYRARNNLQPNNIRIMFTERGGGYNLRGE